MWKLQSAFWQRVKKRRDIWNSRHVWIYRLTLDKRHYVVCLPLKWYHNRKLPFVDMYWEEWQPRQWRSTVGCAKQSVWPAWITLIIKPSSGQAAKFELVPWQFWLQLTCCLHQKSHVVFSNIMDWKKGKVSKTESSKHHCWVRVSRGDLETMDLETMMGAVHSLSLSWDVVLKYH